MICNNLNLYDVNEDILYIVQNDLIGSMTSTTAEDKVRGEEDNSIKITYPIIDEHMQYTLLKKRAKHELLYQHAA